MTPERWRQVEELYQAARDPEKRASVLAAADPELRREVEALLAQQGDSTVTQFAAGAHLGPYKIEAPIGAGAMGEVFRARDTRLHRTVAIKVLPHDRVADPDRKRRFLQEARAASALNHPNIVVIYDISSETGTDFLVMEYVRGKNLKELITSQGLPFTEVCRYGAQISSALAAAHAAGIVHRDIKPANIMVTPEGQIKVLDFGVAKLTEPVHAEGETRTQIELTTPGIVVGTVAYMSPEQTRGEDLDGRSDIFSLGSVLYEAATGRLPFQGASMLAVMHEIATRVPPAPSGLGAGLPPEFDRVVERALAKSRQDRYASAAELGAVLQVLAGPAPSATLPVAPAPPRWRWKLAATAAAAVLLIAGALAYYLLPTRGAIDSIAVLPFTNASNDPSLEYQADGLTEELINSLTQAPNLKVMARATVFRYKGRALDPQEIGKQLGVRAVLMGRIVRMDDRATVQADLVDTKDGSQLWGRQFNRPVAELQAIHEEIAQQVVGKIQPGGGDQKRLAKRHMVDPQAYDLYLQGRRAIADVTAPRIRQSLVYFQQAIARDSNYAAAYAGLADSYSYLALFELEAPKDVMPKAKEAALKALELDNETAEAYTSLGIVESVYDWDWAGSEKRFRRAVELNPGNAYEQHWLGHYYETMGQWQDAQNQMQKALALDPLNPMYGEDVGFDLMINHRPDEAVQQLRRVIELDPEDAIAHSFLALALEAKGLTKESLAENDKARQYGAAFVTGSIAGVYCRAGRPAEARKMLAEIESRAKQQYVAPLQQAVIHFALGENEEGFRFLNLSAEQRDFNLQYEGTDPAFNPVRRDPRLIALRQKLGLPEAAWDPQAK
jgi:eukaryotic-like serine/threonine-protein kinase